MTSFGPLDACPWQGQPENGWLPELLAPLDGVVLGSYDFHILEWAASTLDWPTLRVLVSLLHRARAAESLEVHVENEEESATADALRYGIELLASAHDVALDSDLLSQLLADARGEG